MRFCSHSVKRPTILLNSLSRRVQLKRGQFKWVVKWLKGVLPLVVIIVSLLANEAYILASSCGGFREWNRSQQTSRWLAMQCYKRVANESQGQGQLAIIYRLKLKGGLRNSKKTTRCSQVLALDLQGRATFLISREKNGKKPFRPS